MTAPGVLPVSAPFGAEFQQTLEEAFPAVDAGMLPFGSRVLVQIRTPVKRSRGGIVLPDEVRDTEKWNTQTAKVVALGPVAFKDRKTLEPWPEQAWCGPGDFVRVPKYGGDRWEIHYGTSDDERALFVLFNDLDLQGKITIDPRSIKAFI